MNSLRVENVVRTDVVVVGSGIAGMTAALRLEPLSVALVTKGALGRASSSWLAQGGIAIAVGEDDSPELHAVDTLAVGGGLSDRKSVELVTREGPRQLESLIELGAAFERESSGRIHLGREAAHSRRRIVHANGDATGAAVTGTLERSVAEEGSIHLFEHCQALDLLVDEGRAAGVLVLGPEGKLTALVASATVIATGGIGSVFLWTTNPPESIGDGLAMAARAGVQLVDLEFMQFHPTALAVESNPLPLLTEALRGEGAVLVDSNGTRFMVDEHPLAELAPRDVVSRAIWRRLGRGVKVYLDVRKVFGGRSSARFPTVSGICRDHGLNPSSDLLPVTPAAHYYIGGIAVDHWGRASLPGLWACGEVAATLLHGANRLASNSLLEALVFGDRVAQGIKSDWRPRKMNLAPFRSIESRIEVGPRPSWAPHIRRLMWDKVGLVRDEAGLTAALDELTRLEFESGRTLGESRNMLTVSRLLASAALVRRESRGVHFRSDYPTASAAFERHLYFTDAEPGCAFRSVAQAR